MKRSEFLLGFFTVGATALVAACSPASKITEDPFLMSGKQNIRTREMRSESFHVAGNCETCKQRIETAATSLPGVAKASWSAEKQTLTVRYFSNQTNGLTIQKAVTAVGHDTDNFKADVAVYDKLPSCCRYDRHS